MRLLLGLVRPGASRGEIAELLEESSTVRLFSVGILTAAVLSAEPGSTRQSDEEIKIFGSAGDLQLTARVDAGEGVSSEFVQPVLRGDSHSFVALPMNSRTWLPVTLTEMIDFAEHADSLVLLPHDPRRSTIMKCSDIAGIPDAVEVRCDALGSTDL